MHCTIMEKIIKDIFLIVFSGVIVCGCFPPFFLFIICPLLIHRHVVIFLSKFHPGLFAPLNTDDTITVIDSMYTKSNSVIVLFLELKGKLDYDLLYERVKKLVDSNKHPKLKCILTRWLFTFFWKPCSIFQLSEHFSQNEESDVEKVSKIVDQLTTKPMRRGKPLWEMVVFPNYSKNPEIGIESAVAIKFHHCLADAYGVLSVMRDIADPSNLLEDLQATEKRIMQRLQRPLWKKVLFLLELIFITPTEVAYSYLKGLEDDNMFTLNDYEKSGELVQYQNKPAIEMQWVKGIAKKLNVSVTFVVFAGITAGLRKTLLENGGPEAVRRNVTISTVWPKPGHPAQITNHVTIVPIEAPVSVADSKKRLEIITNRFHRLFFSPKIIGQIAINSMIGLVQGAFNKEARVAHFGTAVLSNFAIFGEPFKILGLEVVTGRVQTGTQTGNVSLFIACVSYNGKLLLGLNGDKNVLRDKGICEKFMSFVIEEFTALDQL